MKIGYVRVSTVEQNEERQLEALRKYNLDKIYSEKVSAKDTNRPKLKEMLDFARQGDTIYILDFSRLSRSVSDLLKIVEMLESKKIHLVSLKENLDTSTPTGRLMLTMIAAINEFERANLLERQREGIAIAKAKGKYTGRKKIILDIAEFAALFDMYMRREITKTEFAKRLGVSRPTIDRRIKEYKANQNNKL